MTTDAARHPARQGETRAGAGLLVLLGALSAFSPFATDAYLPGMPAIAQALGTDLAHVQLSLSSYFAGMCAGQLLYGPLCDALGRRRPLLAAVALFTLASLLLMVVQDARMLIGGRMLQALGGCAGAIVARAMIQDLMQGREAARALTAMMMVQGLSPVLAPLVGAGLLRMAGWRSVFAFLALFGGACWLAAWRTLPETLPPAQRGSLRLATTLRTFATLLRTGAFVQPMLVAAAAMGAMFAYITGSPGVMIQLHGLSPSQYGAMFAVNALGMIAAGRLNVRLLRARARGDVLCDAVCVMTCAAVLLVLLDGQRSLWTVLLPLFVCMACVSLVAANATALAMAAGRQAAGSASSLVGALQFGMAACASALVSAFENGTALPMAAVMAGCTLLAVVLAWWPRF
ncbi:multidrug effflux MFS transporter [[Pseudomonas] boreopolis]|uniref:multidrug effflux MFS transporter n=1 Tax=Xanthomonas boreopolis TaxID=86183 RepID=UPI003D9B8386